MTAANIAFTTPVDAPKWERWLLLSPVARIILFALMTIVIKIVTILVSQWTGLAGTLVHFLQRVVPALGAYLLLVLLIERRRPRELAWRDLLPQTGIGLTVGIVLISAVIATLWLAGSYHVQGTGGDVDWLSAILLLGLSTAISEEIVLRGVLFRVVEEGLGSWAALAISALAFGAIHLGNPSATLWSASAIAIEAGVLLGLLYCVTRSLWTCMGLHAAWNVMEGPVYGTSVSGLPAHGWLQSSMTGPTWLSGGSFGPEASLVTVAWCGTLSLLLLVIALRRQSIVPPFWRRQSNS